MKNSIKKHIILKATISRVWQALTDHREFSEWFGVKLEAPFKVGQTARGHITYPGYEYLMLEAVVHKMDPEKCFSFTWHPYAVDPKVDYSTETPTLVEFELHKLPEGTRLSVTESGFEKIPSHRRSVAHQKNSEGWAIQMENIQKYLVMK